MKPKNGIRSYARLLIWTAAIVNIPRYAGAFMYADLTEIPPLLSYWLNIFNAIGGVAMGIIEAVSMAFIMDGLRQTPLITTAKNGKRSLNIRWFVTAGFGLGMMAIAIIILVPFMDARMNDFMMRQILPDLWWQSGWNLFVVLAPLFIIAGASFSQSDFVHGGGDASKPKELPQSDEQVTEKKWHDLTSANIAFISAHRRKAIMAEFGVSDGTAGNWKRRVAAGETPWQRA